MLAVPPSAAYLDYIDLRVLCMLFCLMSVVQGLQHCNLFEVLARKLLSGKRRSRILMLILVLLPFFASMLVTNDVALITFVPFTILVLNLIGRGKSLAWVVVLQTLGANLGSMATPVGNPQNLFLYSRYGLSPGEFFWAVLPVALVSLLCLGCAALWTRRETIEVTFHGETQIHNPKLLLLYVILFLLCILSVFHLLHYGVLTAVVLACMLLFSRRVLLAVDYGLLFTFVCFFIFAGNMGGVAEIRSFLTGLLDRNAFLSSVLASQVISNVPSAVLLAGFTENWKALLLGVDVGGLGTPVASLASLISLKLYLRAPGARPAYYLGIFTLANFVGLAVLLPLALLLLS
ncbi:Inner membrane protein YbiR [bioreactor metagenome]|uniref:Inner membrane protein YbiR n=1 Tax=bioreactor metagenome TaxID=1076179 RepID=A0A644Z035_9ZZZZ